MFVPLIVHVGIGRPRSSLKRTARTPLWECSIFKGRSSDKAAARLSRAKAKSYAPEMVTRNKWLVARKAHLQNEKALTRMRDLVGAGRRARP
jgi:hypothetical protein